jgi:phosphatidylglycerophosphate synthase
VTDRAARWSALHRDLDPATVPLLRPWLRGMWWLAQPLVRLRVAPTVVTVFGVVAAVAAGPAVGLSPWLALGLVVAAVLADGLDGAVALLAGRAGAAGARADAVADRVADCAFAAVIWRCGAPWWLAGLAAAISLVHEGVRARRPGSAVRITVAERPTRAICTVLAAGSAGVSSAAWPASVCAGVWVGLGVAGLVQLARS